MGSPLLERYSAPKLHAALDRIWLEECSLPEYLVYIRTPVGNWLAARARCLGDPPSLDWVLKDPVVGHLAPAIYGLSGRKTNNGVADEYQPFAGIYYRNSVRWLQEKDRIDSILALLAREEIPCILLKGASLQHQIYHNSGLRNMGDVDLLVMEKDFIRAIQVLQKLDIQITARYGQSTESIWRLPVSAWPTELSLSNKNNLHLDIHRNLLTTHRFSAAYSVDIDGVWKRSTLSQTEPGWRSLSHEDMMAHLCLHQVLHGFRR